MGKTKESINISNDKVLYMNKPISDRTVDGIGVDIHVDYLENAIEKGADMIAIVSGFGTGKSSLIELLKKKYHGWTADERTERVYCQVNLWSQLEADKIDTIDLHRTFLYQLVSSVYPEKSSYFSRRTGRNFGLFKISAESPLWSVLINISIVLLAFTALIQHFSEDIVASGIFQENIVHLIIIIGYFICASVVVLLFLRTEIIFSTKQSEGTREIEENELIDLYKEHVLIQRKWYHNLVSKWMNHKHIIVVIEDLDRTEAGDSVYLFLKELRKYYVPNEQKSSNFINQITFVVNIMPENELRRKCKHLEEGTEYVYNKVFDYSFSLNKINIDNYDVILEALITEKKEELHRLGIVLLNDDNVHNIPGMQWVILGKDVSIRQVKDRLNEAIILYDSLKYKFGIEKAEFEKCAAVAYLRSEFPVEFNKMSDHSLEEMLTFYATTVIEKDDFVSLYSKNTEDREFYKRLFDMIQAHLIDDNYRSYFYNYPKESHLYTVKETRVRNLLIYNEKITEDVKTDIMAVAVERPEVIVDAMSRTIELISRLPKAVLFSSELWKLAHANFSTHLFHLISTEFSQIKAILPEHIEMLDSIVNIEHSSDILCEAVLKNETKMIVQIRGLLLQKHLDKIADYVSLFRVDEAPLKLEELEKMSEVSLKHILDMIDGTVCELEREVLDQIHDRIKDEENKEIVIHAESFYKELLLEHSVVDMVQYLFDYMNHRRQLIVGFLDLICEAIKTGKISSHYYFVLLNSMDMTEVNQAQLQYIRDLDIPGEISKDICDKLKDGGYAKEYLLNMIEKFSDEICMEWDELLSLLKRDCKEIWTKHSEIFLKIRIWACEKFKDKMIDLEECFKAPYPIITVNEIQCMIQPDTALKLYDASRASSDEGEAFAEFCNRQFRKSDIAFSMFHFISTMEKPVIKKVFYKLNMHNVRFSLMGAKRKLQIIEELRVPLLLNDSSEVVKFMNFTECLVPELEKQIQPDLKNDETLCKEYIQAIQKSGKLSEIAYKNLFNMPSIYAYGDMINEKLFERKEYIRYICSKTQESGVFEIDDERVDELWDSYLYIFKNAKRYGKTAPRMGKNKGFLKLVQNRNAYANLPEESRLALASILQDEKTLLDILNYTDEFAIKYFSAIAGFTSKNAAQTFVQIMAQHQKYAQNKNIYNNVYEKLGNAQLKGQYTKLYKNANS